MPGWESDLTAIRDFDDLPRRDLLCAEDYLGDRQWDDAHMILESQVGDDVPRFAQHGSEHPREYKEYLVEAEHFEAARGRAVDEGQAIGSYCLLTDIHPRDAAGFTVQEIIPD